MVMIALDNAPESVRGELTKWFLELKPGVFIGNVNARIRELLWDRVCATSSANGAVMAYSSNTEQGFTFILAGTPKRTIVDFDGILLVKNKHYDPLS